MTRIPVGRSGIVVVVLSVLTVLLVAGCEVNPTPNGGFRVVPSLGEDPSIGGVYHKTWINGQCYLTNGIWCIACNGGERVRCSDILKHTRVAIGDEDDVDFEVKPFQQDSQELTSGGPALCEMTLAERFYELTGGLDGETFAIVNGLKIDEQGGIVPLELPYPGSNLLSLASGGAIYIRDPHRTLVEDQLNAGMYVTLADADWQLILPYLRENERLFGIQVERDLLTVDGVLRKPSEVYRKVTPLKDPEVEAEMEGLGD